MNQDESVPEKSTYHTIDASIAEELKRSIPNRDVLDEVGTELKMVANTTRLRILCYLGQRDLCVHDLTALLDLSQSAISHQLQKLRDRGFLQSHKDGRVVYYSLKDEKLQDMITWLQDFFE